MVKEDPDCRVICLMITLLYLYLVVNHFGQYFQDSVSPVIDFPPSLYLWGERGDLDQTAGCLSG
jgi:hypothetical protein